MAAEPIDGRADDLDCPVDIGGGGGVAEREAKRAERGRSVDAHRGEHMGWLHRTARAGRCSRGTHVGLVEQEQQRLGFDAVDADVCGTSHLVLARHGFGDAFDPTLECIDQLVAELCEAFVLADALAIGEVEGDSGGNDAGGVVGATATFAFLSTTDDQRIDLRATTLDQYADSFWAAELVGAERQQVDVRGDLAQVEPARRLDGVGVYEGVRCVTPYDTGDLGDVGDRADLVVDCHDTDDRDLRRCVECRGEFVEVDPAERIDADDATPIARVIAELLDDVQDGVVLDRRADGDASTASDGTTDGHVVALGSATGEHHLVRVAADDTSDGVSGLVDGLAGTACEAMRPGRVGIQLGEVRHHRLDRFDAHGRRGSVVEVGDRRLSHPGHATDYIGGQTRDAIGRSLEAMRGYDERSYGDGFADVYDEWYADVTDVAATVTRMVQLTSPAGRLLELGVGTGRLAVPMAEAGLVVTGIDSSDAMLAKLAERDGERRVDAILGDMIDDLPDGPFESVLVAYNTIFNLLVEGDQQRLFHEVARRLEPGGVFVVEAFVPDLHPDGNSSMVDVRSMAVDHVVLSVSSHRHGDQRAEGQFIQLSESGGVRLRPWSIRWATPPQLDAMATAAGFRLADRWADMAGTPFTDDSTQHVTVYRRVAPR